MCQIRSVHGSIPHKIIAILFIYHEILKIFHFSQCIVCDCLYIFSDIKVLYPTSTKCIFTNLYVSIRDCQRLEIGIVFKQKIPHFCHRIHIISFLYIGRKLYYTIVFSLIYIIIPAFRSCCRCVRRVIHNIWDTIFVFSFFIQLNNLICIRCRRRSQCRALFFGVFCQFFPFIRSICPISTLFAILACYFYKLILIKNSRNQFMHMLIYILIRISIFLRKLCRSTTGFRTPGCFVIRYLRIITSPSTIFT